MVSRFRSMQTVSPSVNRHPSILQASGAAPTAGCAHNAQSAGRGFPISPLRVLQALLAALMVALIGAVNPSPAAAHPLARSPLQLGGTTGTDYGIHIVREGDTLYGLAVRYGMSVPDLATLNGIRITGYLLPGAGLRVPLDRAINARADEPAAPARASSAVGTESSAAGDSVAPEREPSLTATQADAATHLVQPGDTLFSIAARHGLDIEGLKTQNGLPLDGSIRAGETLVLRDGPARDRAATPDTAPPAPVSGQPPAAPVAAPNVKTTTHIVQPGEALTSIAARYGSTALSLQRMNGLSGDLITAGQRLIVPRQGTGYSPGFGDKRVEVDIGDQRMYVWEGNHLVYNWTISTGLATHPTRRGSFAVQSKIPNAWSSAWQLWMPNWLGIYWAGGSENGIHALPIINGTRLWGGYLGSPISYGCVVVDTFESQLLYEWAEIGTPVDIHD